MNYCIIANILLVISHSARGINVDDENQIFSSMESTFSVNNSSNLEHSVSTNESNQAKISQLEQIHPNEIHRPNQSRLQTHLLDRRKPENMESWNDLEIHETLTSSIYTPNTYENLTAYLNNSNSEDFSQEKISLDDSLLYKNLSNDIVFSQEDISIRELSLSFSNSSSYRFRILPTNESSSLNEVNQAEFPIDEDINWKSMKEDQSDWRMLLDNFQGQNTNDFCRARDGRFLPPQLFSWDSCARCYLLEILKDRRPGPWSFTYKSITLNQQSFGVLFLINITETNGSDAEQKLTAAIPSERLFKSVSDLKFRENWQKCCDAAVNCCHKMLKTSRTNVTNMCPRTWDGWQCWEDTLPNTETFESCPKYIYINTDLTCQKFAVKHCEEDGQWYRKNNSEWSNYSPCSILPNIQLRILCHLCALSLSVMALTPALLIFCCYRQLRVHRITLHKQLFISLLLEASCTIAFQLLQLFRVDIIGENNLWCVLLTLFRRYARQTNYMWYLCEGYYLHKLLAAAFAEQRSLHIFYVIGWGFPVIIIAIYASLRGILFQNSHCWEMPIEEIEWMMQLPPLIAILTNLIFLVNIIRILLGKVRAGNDNEPSQYRMAVRATLMVIPLFGLQYIITIYRPQGQTCDWLYIYHLINNIIDGSTGFLVAVIFCFANGEVRNLLRRSWKRKREKRPPFGSYRSSRASFPFASRSLSTAQTTFVNTNNHSRRTSSIISMGLNCHFGNKNILKNSGPVIIENKKIDHSRRSERIKKARSVSQVLDIVKIGDSSYSIAFSNSKPLNSRVEEVGENFRAVSPSFLQQISPSNNSSKLYGNFQPENENISFIDDACSLSGESQQLTLGDIINNKANNCIAKKSLYCPTYHRKEMCSFNLKEEDSI